MDEMANYYPTGSRSPSPTTPAFPSVGGRPVDYNPPPSASELGDLMNLIAPDVQQLGLNIPRTSVPQFIGAGLPRAEASMLAGLRAAFPWMKEVDLALLLAQLLERQQGVGTFNHGGWRVVAECSNPFAGSPGPIINQANRLGGPPDSSWGGLVQACLFDPNYPNGLPADPAATDRVLSASNNDPGNIFGWGLWRQQIWRADASMGEVYEGQMLLDGDPLFMGHPLPVSLGQLASFWPGLAPFLMVQPEPLPFRALQVLNVAAEVGTFTWLHRQVGPSFVERPSLVRVTLDQLSSLHLSGPQYLSIARQMLSQGVPVDAVVPLLRGEPSPTPFPSPDVVLNPVTGNVTVVQPVSQVVVQPMGPPVQVPPDDIFRRPRPRRKEKKFRAPATLIHMLVAATYLGGTVRNLHRSLPKACQTPVRYGKRRRYDSMMADIYRCFGQIDFDKFTYLEALMVTKYAAEGQALAEINRSGVGQGFGFGGATQLLHANAPQVDASGNPNAGGAFAHRNTPFDAVDLAIHGAEQVLGIR